MTDIKLPYTRIVRSKGRKYYYYRREGIQLRIEGDPGSPQFIENYQRIHSSFERGPRNPGVRPGSIEALIRTYYQSSEFTRLSNRSKREYRSYIEPFREKVGHKLAGTFRRRDFLAIRDSLQDTPSAADHAIKVLRLLFGFAVDREWITTNPAANIKKLAKSDGWQAWPTPAIERAHDLLTGAARVAFMLALYTGQRKGDILAMRWNAIEGEGIHVKQQKTGKQLWIPLHPVLAKELTKIGRRGMTIVARRDDRPYTTSGFSTIWKRQQRKLGLTGLQFHGLRRNAVNALLEADCHLPEVAAITGQSFEMVQHYSQEVNQRRLASSAMNKLETSSGKPIGKLSVVGGRDDL